VTWTQVYDPLGHWWLSTLLAALPIVVLLGLLAGLKVRPHLCAIAGAATAVLVAMIVFQMPALLAVSSFFYGAAFGLLKIVWIVIAAVFLYDISVETGQFEIMKQSVAAITPDRRLQLLLVAFCFGAFIEGCAGFGAPVAIAGAFMIGLGFKPFQAAALNLIANTSPVAWGAIGTPVHTLAAVTALNESDLNAMIGRILPITAVVVPFWLVRSMVSWKETLQVFPAILVVGGSFAATQWFWANHMDSNLVDISAGVVSLVVTMLFLRVWQPKQIWRFPDEATVNASATSSSSKRDIRESRISLHYSAGQTAKAWMPFLILSIFVLCWGLPSIKNALTGSDTSSNALFGNLQRITAQQLHLSPILMCATNSAGGVMGKMVDAQSICIATAATNQVGNEGSIFRYLFWHSVALAAIVGGIVMLYAYVFPQYIPNGLNFIR
jgi:lactate permease